MERRWFRLVVAGVVASVALVALVLCCGERQVVAAGTRQPCPAVVSQTTWFTYYLPYIASPVYTTEVITVPVTIMYEVTSYGSFTVAMGMEYDVELIPKTHQYHLLSSALHLPAATGSPDYSYIGRSLLIFDLPQVAQVLTATLRTDYMTYVPTSPTDDVPLMVSQAGFDAPASPQQAFTGGARGSEWAWWFTQTAGGAYCNAPAQHIPVDFVDWERGYLTLFTRSGAEDRRDLWPVSASFFHNQGWGTICPNPLSSPVLVLTVVR